MNVTMELKQAILDKYIVLNQNGNDYFVINKEILIWAFFIIAWVILGYLWLFKCRKIFFNKDYGKSKLLKQG